MLQESGDDPDIIDVPSSEPEPTKVADDETETAAQEETSRLIAGLARVSDTELPTGTDSGSGEPALPVVVVPVSQPRPDGDLISPSAGDVASVQREHITPDPDRFFDLDYAQTLRRLIRRIVDREGPIPLHGLARRVAQEHGWQRTGKRIQAQVQSNLSLVERHLEFETVFVWVPGSHSDRAPFRGLNGRSIRDISRTEIGSVIDAHAQTLASEEDPILALSRLLGIARLRKDARAYLSECLQWVGNAGNGGREMKEISSNELERDAITDIVQRIVEIPGRESIQISPVPTAIPDAGRLSQHPDGRSISTEIGESSSTLRVAVPIDKSDQAREKQGQLIQPIAFWLDGVRHEVTTSRQVLVEICGLLKKESGPVFEERVSALRGRTRYYFNASREKLKDGLPVPGSPLYVEGNVSAKLAETIVRQTLLAIRGSDRGFRIEKPDGP